MDSVAYAAREEPRTFPVRAPLRQPRQTKRLPALSSGSSGKATAQQKAETAKKREEAVRRKREKQRQSQPLLPQSTTDDDDPFGHGRSVNGE